MPGQDWLTYVIVRLPAELAGAGEVQVYININGTNSNKAPLNINPPTGGP